MKFKSDIEAWLMNKSMKGCEAVQVTGSYMVIERSKPPPQQSRVSNKQFLEDEATCLLQKLFFFFDKMKLSCMYSYQILK